MSNNEATIVCAACAVTPVLVAGMTCAGCSAAWFAPLHPPKPPTPEPVYVERPCSDCGESTYNDKRCRDCDIDYLTSTGAVAPETDDG